MSSIFINQGDIFHVRPAHDAQIQVFPDTQQNTPWRGEYRREEYIQVGYIITARNTNTLHGPERQTEFSGISPGALFLTMLQTLWIQAHLGL